MSRGFVRIPLAARAPAAVANTVRGLLPRGLTTDRVVNTAARGLGLMDARGQVRPSAIDPVRTFNTPAGAALHTLELRGVARHLNRQEAGRWRVLETLGGRSFPHLRQGNTVISFRVRNSELHAKRSGKHGGKLWLRLEKPMTTGELQATMAMLARRLNVNAGISARAR